MSDRKRFLTTIDPDILLEFKIACTKNKKDMNDIMEMLMLAFYSGKITLEDLSKDK